MATKKEKVVKPETEFKQFFKTLYETVQLNFDDYFEISNKDNEFLLTFPTAKYYYLDGDINLDSFPSMKKYIMLDTMVRFKSSDVDDIRKKPLKNIIGLDINEDYILHTQKDDVTQDYKFSRVNSRHKKSYYDFKYKMQIDENVLTDRSILQIYLKDNELTYEPTTDMVFDSAISGLKVLFKKDATYTLYATEKVNNFRIVMVEGKSDSITLRQYFRVI